MRPKVALSTFLAGVLLVPPFATGQAASATATQEETPTFGVGTAAVTVDIVVRDKKQRAVRDLTAADFEVFEEGVRQTIDAFTVVRRDAPPEYEPAKSAEPAAAGAAPKEGTEAPAREAAAAPSASEPPTYIVFVFDRLTTGARDLAHKAALSYLGPGRRDGDLAAVFSIDLSLRNLAPFTKDPGEIKEALDRAARQGQTTFAADREETRGLAEDVSQVESQLNSATSQQGSGAAGAIGQLAVAQAEASASLSMLRGFEALERDQQGFATTHGLLAVVNGLRPLAGRKTVVFFSEGLSIPSNVQAQFRSVIHAANRANVSVYAFDAGGLRTNSPLEETRKELDQTAARRLQQLARVRETGTDGILTRQLERNEDNLRLNPHSGLGQLAEQTGGFLIRDTNDAKDGFNQIREDMRFHYILSYSPVNESYDGRYRKISVKVKRSGVEVHSRDGYYAVRPDGATVPPLRTYEAPALAFLDRSPHPAAFPISATGLWFPAPKRPGRVPILVEVPATALTYVPEEQDKKMQRADFTIVARVKDAPGQVVDRMSQNYTMRAPAANVEAAKRGSILFYREADLPPGRYTVEAVGYDALGQRASVTSAKLEVPQGNDTHTRLSSVTIVRNVEPLPEAERGKGHPFQYGETLVYPSLGESLHKAVGRPVSFYFSVLPPKGGPAPGKATLEILREGRSLGQIATDLPAPDAEGRIEHAGALPIAAFQTGAYELRVSVPDGQGKVTSSAVFTVEE